MSTIRAEQTKSELMRRNRGTDHASNVMNRETSEFNFAKLMGAGSHENELVDCLLEHSFVTQQAAQALSRWIPARIGLNKARLLFSMTVHGTSFTQFWRRCEPCAPTLLVIHTDKGKTFGAYCSAAWRERNAKERATAKFFGTGESFVFTLDGTEPQRYAWVGAAEAAAAANGGTVHSTQPRPYSQEMFMAAGNDWLTVGGGGGTALHISESLVSGQSSACDTFANPPLHGVHAAGTDNGFGIAALIVFGFFMCADDPLPGDDEDAENNEQRLEYYRKNL